MIDAGADTAQIQQPAGLSRLVRAFVRSPIEPASWRATLAIFLGIIVAGVAISIVSACFSTGGSLLLFLVGIPIIGLGIEASRFFAEVERWRAVYVDRRPVRPHAYRPLDLRPARPYGAWARSSAEAVFLDANRWRDVVYILVLFPLAMLEAAVLLTVWVAAIALMASPLIVAALRSLDATSAFVDQLPVGWDGGLAVAVVIGMVLVPVATSVARGLMRLHRAVVEGLLCVDPNEALRQDVERLRGSRSAALELEASELRRIERDLHDGAQQRLVALAMDLGLAEERLDTDPAGAKALIADARSQARQALTELRELVRGTAPAILLDRGLDAAIASLAGGSPVPTTLDSTLGSSARLPAAVERAAYFVVSESLANVAKHGAASRCDIRLGREAGMLVVEVTDDGTGGAVVTPGGGLAGLRDRVEALDGSLDITSPPGGPTVVRVTLPLPPE